MAMMGSVAHVYSDTSTSTRMWLLAAGGPLEPLRRRHWRLIPRNGRTNALCVCVCVCVYPCAVTFVRIEGAD